MAIFVSVQGYIDMKRLFPVLLLIASLLVGGNSLAQQTAHPLTVGSFNLRYINDHDGDNSWANRCQMVTDLIGYYGFDFLGTQEGYLEQLRDIDTLDNYDYIGVGRDDGKEAGEHSAIFYRTDRFDLLDQGDFWLSETPEVPSHGWDASECLRICSWGHFRDRISGKTLYFFNVHYDHVGQEARRQSSHLLLSRIRPLLDRGETVILTGDFNAGPDEEPIRILREAALLRDSRTISQAKPYGPSGTFHDFDLSNFSDEPIDYIWVSPNIRVDNYRTITDQDHGRLPSDHFPIMTHLTLSLIHI